MLQWYLLNLSPVATLRKKLLLSPRGAEWNGCFMKGTKSLGTGEKSNECKHWSKLFSCSKRILRKLAQWVMMSSFSPLNYWKNLPLWAVCMCLCWVRTWHSSFSTHFCYKKVPFVFCNPKKILAWTLSVFCIFDTVNVGTVVCYVSPGRWCLWA